MAVKVEEFAVRHLHAQPWPEQGKDFKGSVMS